jgi:hypothetical protein
MKVKINHQLVVSISAVGEVEFGKEFLDRVQQCVAEIGKNFNATVAHTDLDSKCIIAEFHGVRLDLATDLKSKFIQEVVLLAEHGPDSDLLDLLIKRYPRLQTHPNLSSVVGAFENLNGVIQDVLSLETNATKALAHKREGLEIDPEDLKAVGGTKRTMTPAERAEFRTQAILGQTTEQVAAKGRTVPKAESGIPDVYKKVAKHTVIDPEAIGDEGNVFARPSKG